MAVAVALGIAVIFADRTFEWAVVGMLTAILAALAYDTWRQ